MSSSRALLKQKLLECFMHAQDKDITSEKMAEYMAIAVDQYIEDVVPKIAKNFTSSSHTHGESVPSDTVTVNVSGMSIS